MAVINTTRTPRANTNDCIYNTFISFQMILFIPGPYLGIAGAAFLEKPVCEPLVPVMPSVVLPHNECMLLETAHLFKALKIALSDLEKFYDQLRNQQDLDISDLNDQLYM